MLKPVFPGEMPANTAFCDLFSMIANAFFDRKINLIHHSESIKTEG